MHHPPIRYKQQMSDGEKVEINRYDVPWGAEYADAYARFTRCRQELMYHKSYVSISPRVYAAHVLHLTIVRVYARDMAQKKKKLNHSKYISRQLLEVFATKNISQAQYLLERFINLSNYYMQFPYVKFLYIPTYNKFMQVYIYIAFIYICPSHIPILI